MIPSYNQTVAYDEVLGSDLYIRVRLQFIRDSSLTNQMN